MCAPPVGARRLSHPPTHLALSLSQHLPRLLDLDDERCREAVWECREELIDGSWTYREFPRKPSPLHRLAAWTVGEVPSPLWQELSPQRCSALYSSFDSPPADEVALHVAAPARLHCPCQCLLLRPA